MRKSLLIVVIAVATFAGSRPASAASCNRQCLDQLLNRYFEALAAHDASRLQFSSDIRFTENTNVLKIGDGLWQRAGKATYRLDAIDPMTEQMASNAVTTDNGKPAILFVRMKVKNKQISELETIVVRPGEGQRSMPETFTAQPALYEETVPKDKRVPRQQVAAAGDAYLDALHTAGTDSFKLPPIADDARRVENGWQTVPTTVPGRPRIGINEGFKNRRLPPGATGGTEIVSRRYLVDEEHGIALVIGLMNHEPQPAQPAQLTQPAQVGGPIPQAAGGGVAMPPLHAVEHHGEWNQILIEFFKVSDGQVREIQATMYDMDDPKHQTTGW